MMMMIIIAIDNQVIVTIELSEGCKDVLTTNMRVRDQIMDNT